MHRKSKGKRWRKTAERFARRHGFFWLPCPLCDEMFGGQEWIGGASIRVGDELRGICPACAGARMSAAEERLRSLGVTVEVSVTRGSRWVDHRIGA